MNSWLTCRVNTGWYSVPPESRSFEVWPARPAMDSLKTSSASRLSAPLLAAVFADGFLLTFSDDESGWRGLSLSLRLVRRLPEVWSSSSCFFRSLECSRSEARLSLLLSLSPDRFWSSPANDDEPSRSCLSMELVLHFSEDLSRDSHFPRSLSDDCRSPLPGRWEIDPFWRLELRLSLPGWRRRLSDKWSPSSVGRWLLLREWSRPVDDVRSCRNPGSAREPDLPCREIDEALWLSVAVVDLALPERSLRKSSSEDDDNLPWTFSRRRLRRPVSARLLPRCPEICVSFSSDICASLSLGAELTPRESLSVEGNEWDWCEICRGPLSRPGVFIVDECSLAPGSDSVADVDRVTTSEADCGTSADFELCRTNAQTQKRSVQLVYNWFHNACN